MAKNAPTIITDIMNKLEWLVKVAKPIVIAFVFAYIFDPVNQFFELQYKKIKIRKGVKGSKNMGSIHYHIHIHNSSGNDDILISI